MNIPKEMLLAASQSIITLKHEITDVKHAGFSDDFSQEKISFNISGPVFKKGKYIGYLKGRNVELCVGHGEIEDKAIAARILIDGDATFLKDV